MDDPLFQSRNLLITEKIVQAGGQSFPPGRISSLEIEVSQIQVVRGIAGIFFGFMMLGPSFNTGPLFMILFLAVSFACFVYGIVAIVSGLRGNVELIAYVGGEKVSLITSRDRMMVFRIKGIIEGLMQA